MELNTPFRPFQCEVLHHRQENVAVARVSLFEAAPVHTNTHTDTLAEVSMCLCTLCLLQRFTQTHTRTHSQTHLHSHLVCVCVCVLIIYGIAVCNSLLHIQDIGISTYTHMYSTSSELRRTNSRTEHIYTFRALSERKVYEWVRNTMSCLALLLRSISFPLHFDCIDSFEQLCVSYIYIQRRGNNVQFSSRNERCVCCFVFACIQALVQHLKCKTKVVLSELRITLNGVRHTIQTVEWKLYEWNEFLRLSAECAEYTVGQPNEYERGRRHTDTDRKAVIWSLCIFLILF